MATKRLRARQLKKSFDAAHREGMRALQNGDLTALTKAIQTEAEIVHEQRNLIEQHVRQSGMLRRQTPTRRGKARS